ncbi:MAG: acetolactate synthase small subunit [Tissierellia bacterium]|nr:acetolactate synthase small subunit [Tissierellia bacterium]
MKNRFTVGLIVSNHFGVLYRISGLFNKRGYNIDSLTVGETEDREFSRMTIVSTGDDYIRDQVVKQLNKLHDVKMAVLLEDDKSVSVEHLLIKLRTNGSGNSEVAALLNAYGGKVMDIGEGYIMADMTGPTERIHEFINKSIPFGILELCRSGNLSLSKDANNLLSAHLEREFEED